MMTDADRACEYLKVWRNWFSQRAQDALVNRDPQGMIRYAQRAMDFDDVAHFVAGNARKLGCPMPLLGLPDEQTDTPPVSDHADRLLCLVRLLGLDDLQRKIDEGEVDEAGDFQEEDGSIATVWSETGIAEWLDSQPPNELGEGWFATMKLLDKGRSLLAFLFGESQAPLPAEAPALTDEEITRLFVESCRNNGAALVRAYYADSDETTRAHIRNLLSFLELSVVLDAPADAPASEPGKKCGCEDNPWIWRLGNYPEDKGAVSYEEAP